MSGQGEARVLVVDDEKRLAETYRIQLQSEYDVDVATSGEQALSTVDDGYDVVLLDRRMPDVSGDEVLEEITARGLDCQVVMVTAVEPDFDIVGMQCTDYVVKPVEADRLRTVVERALRIAEYSDTRRRLGAKKLKRNVLEVEKHERELEDSEEYKSLQQSIEHLEREVDELEAQLGIEEVDRFL